MEKNAQEQIQIRRVTNLHAGWTEAGEGEPGTFTFQLILDDGAREHVAVPTAQDLKVQLKLARRSDSVYFDLSRRVLIFSDVSED